MCGRYELKAKARALNRHFPQLHLSQGEMPQTGEIHPTDTVLMITTGNSTGTLTGDVGARSRRPKAMLRAGRKSPLGPGWQFSRLGTAQPADHPAQRRPGRQTVLQQNPETKPLPDPGHRLL